MLLGGRYGLSNGNSKRRSWRISDLAQHLGATATGDVTQEVHRLSTLKGAGPGSLTFLSNPRYTKQLQQTRASAVLVAPSMAADCPVTALVVDNPYLAYARISHWFDPAPSLVEGVHGTAVIEDDVQLGKSVAIGPHAVVGAGAVIGDGVSLGAGSVVGAGSALGNETTLRANVTLYHGVSLGERCHVHSGSVIGADGFGWANDQGRWVKIAQIGSVRIGNDVDIGASTSIDRGALEDTVIGDGVILDNQIQIAHNVQIGDHTAIAGCVGIAGSTKLGRYCSVAGGVGIAGHLDICDNVHLTASAVITASITKSGSYSSGTAMSPTPLWKKNAVRFRRLDLMAKKINELEKRLEDMGE